MNRRAVAPGVLSANALVRFHTLFGGHAHEHKAESVTATPANGQLTARMQEIAAVQRELCNTLLHQAACPELRAYPRAAEIVRRTRTAIAAHMGTLQDAALRRGASRDSLRASPHLRGLTRWLFDHTPCASVPEMLNADYTGLNACAAGYTMLHAAALAVDDRALAADARRLLAEVTPLIYAISKELPRVVAEDLRRQGLDVDDSAEELSVQLTHAAWRPGTMHSEVARAIEPAPAAFGERAVA